MDALDNILKRRKAPDVPNDLSARIIAAAHRHDQNLTQDRPKPQRTHKPIWDEIFAVFDVPKPAFALAMIVLLILGVGLGVGFTGEIGQGLGTAEFAHYLSIDDRFRAGDWV